MLHLLLEKRIHDQDWDGSLHKIAITRCGGSERTVMGQEMFLDKSSEVGNAHVEIKLFIAADEKEVRRMEDHRLDFELVIVACSLMHDISLDPWS